MINEVGGDRMSRKLSIIFVCTLCLVVSTVNADNLLINGNFNTGDFTGWWTYVPDPTTQSITIDTLDTYDGSPVANMTSATDGAWQELGQDFAATENTTYNLSFVYDAPQWSQAGVNIKYMDAGWNYLGYQWISLVPPNTTGWTAYSSSFTTLAGTAYAEVKFSEGSWGTMYVDNVAVTPEPATMVLLGIGGLVALRRKHT